MRDIVLEARAIHRSFPRPGGDHIVLQDIDLAISDREIIGLLGRSGSGKSTLLRILAGLLEPTGGEVLIHGGVSHGPSPGVAMVFQSFALFPWLTVLQNVEIGLEARRVAPDERRTRSLEAIDLIGLDGFESAFPPELSGGMRQRVGFARALVVQPEVLLLDEPFSALDVLTAEALRSDFMDLWTEGRLPIRSVLLVTHNIEEAVSMCDRLLLLSSEPGTIVAEIPIGLPRPRSRHDPAFREQVEEIYQLMTTQPFRQRRKVPQLTEHLPPVSPNRMIGLSLALAAPPYQGRADLPLLVRHLHMRRNELLHTAELLDRLGLAELLEGDLTLTDLGWNFVRSNRDEQKAIFARQLRRNVPLVEHIVTVLGERPTHRAPWIRFAEELEDLLTSEATNETLRAVIEWGRYGELFAYDDVTETFSLENP